MRRQGVTALRLTWVATRAAARFSQRSAGFFAWRLWFTPWRVEPSDRARRREAQWLDCTEIVTVPFRGGELRGFAAGEGPAVLLVHGWGDRASRLGAFVTPLMDAGFRVVAVDLPAHGDSPGLRTNAYEIADAIRAVADQVVGLHGIIAHSMGGLETMLALRDGLEVQRVVLLASAVRLEHAMDRFAEMFQLSPKAITGLAAAIERRFGATVWSNLAGDRVAADLRVPALLIHDADDQQVAVDDGRLLSRSWPGSRFVTTYGLGHDRLLRDPDVVGRTVQFLQDGAASRDAGAPRTAAQRG